MVTRQAGEIVLDSKRYMLQDPQSWQKQPLIRSGGKIVMGESRYSDYTLWNVKDWTTWHLGRGEEYFETDGRYYDSWNCETRIRRQVTLGPHMYATGTGDMLNYESGTRAGGLLGDSSVNISPPGGTMAYAWAESFATPSGGFTADMIQLFLGKVGSPVNITAAIYTDSDSKPGTLVAGATKTLTHTAVPIPKTYAWVEFDWTGTVALTASTTYWIVVSVTSPVEDHYYLVAVDTGHGYSGSCKYTILSDWSTWVDYSSGGDLWFRLEGAEGELDGAPVRFAFYNDNGTEKLFCAAGTKVYAWNATTNVWADDTSGITGTITDMQVFEDCLVVAQGTTAGLRKKQSGSWANLTDNEEGYKLGIGKCPTGGDAGKVVLIKSGPDSGTDRHKVRCIAAIGDTWQSLKSVDSQDTIVGDSSADITWIGQYMGSIWICKEDGVYEVGTDGIAYCKFPFFTQRAAVNFGGTCVWHRNELMLPCAYGLWSFDGRTLKNIGPGISLGYWIQTGYAWSMVTVGETGQHVGLPSDRQGVIRDLLPAVNALYATIDAGASDDRYSSIMLWNNRGWHEVVRGDAINKRILALGYTAAGTIETEARLWYGYGNSVFYAILPDTTDDPYQWSGSKFENQGWIEFGWFDAGLKTVDKDWRDVTIEAENVDDGSTVEVFYKLDDDTSYTSLGVIDDGTVGTAISDNQATLSFGTDTYGKRIRLKIYLATDDPDNTPKVTGVILKSWKTPDLVWGWKVALKLSEPLDRTWRVQGTDFETTADKKEPVTLVDPNDDESTVRLDKIAMTPLASETGEMTGWLVSFWAYEA